MIELVNNTTQVIRIRDLGIELQPTERVSIDNYDDRYILQSQDLKITMIEIERDGVVISYDKLIRYIKKLSHYDHVIETTLAHNIREDYFFDTEKENDVTIKIIYFKDAAKTMKIREEDIVRGLTGTVSQIISRVYDSFGNIVETETQNMNRDVDGRVESIPAIIQE